MPPERLHTATRQLGAIRLYTNDVVELIGFLARDFNSPRVIVTYHERGNEISRYANDFEKDLDRLGELRFLKLSVQEPEAYGINRLASIELNADGSNEVRVQGVQESWVIGKAEAVTAHLKLYEKALSSTFRKFGLNINGLLAIFALIVLPELTLGKRAIFIAILALLIIIIVQIHNRFIPNVAIYLSNRKPSSFERAWPQIVSWLIAASSALVAAVAYGLLKGGLHDTIKWLAGALG